jgi:eukaryotic-like serine/threonine-protein kinase
MVSPTASRMPIRFGTAPSSDEESRRFLQERLRVFGLWVFVLAFGFLIVNVTLDLALKAERVPSPTLPLGQLMHFSACVVLAVVWLVTLSGRQSMRTLRWLDALGVTLTCGFFGLMGVAYAVQGFGGEGGPNVVGFPILSMVLACTNTVVARAIAVPSRALRTLWISGAALTPVVAATGYIVAVLPLPSVFILASVISWCAVAIGVAGVGSRIIFGLRREVARTQQLGQYTLDAKIGEGGMGIVYKAHHAMLRRPTAIKLLPPDRAGEENIRRFEREVQHTAQLTHPNTVAIFDYGRTPDGVFYYAMEYLDGVNLEELVRRDGAQPPGRVIHILQQVCRALAEAHSLGLIHRDVKPANIILTQRGGEPDVVKVVDFGLVREIDGAGTTMTMTMGNLLTGTPLYMSPEAIRGEDAVDARADLYALGAVGYMLLAGVPVFEGQSAVEVFAHHLHTRPAPPSERSHTGVPADLERVIMQCLAKELDARPQTAAALLDALRACASAQDWSVEKARAWWGRYKAESTLPAASARDKTSVGTDNTLTVDVTDRVVT